MLNWVQSFFGKNRLSLSLESMRDVINYADLERNLIISVTDKHGKIIYANSLFEEISGYSKGELIGSDHRLVNSNFHSKEYIKKMWETVNRGERWIGEFKNRNKNGKYYWVSSVIIPVKNKKNENEKIISFRFDITSIKEMELEKIQEIKLNAIDQFSSGISHEINNPLTIIKGKLFLLKKAVLKNELNLKKIDEDFSKIDSAIDRIANTLKSLRRFTNPVQEYVLQKVPVIKIINSTTELFYESFNNHGIEIKTYFQDLHINCIHNDVVQALINIILNAQDAIIDLEEKWIKLEVKEQDNSILILVTDSGKGIDEKIINNIMEPFFSTKPDHPGRGLGLTVARKYTERSGGTLYYNRNAANTQFVLQFPKVDLD